MRDAATRSVGGVDVPLGGLFEKDIEEEELAEPAPEGDGNTAGAGDTAGGDPEGDGGDGDRDGEGGGGGACHEVPFSSST
jgi:hypothetical protein